MNLRNQVRGFLDNFASKFETLNLSEKSQAVLALFRDLEIENRVFSKQSNLGCVPGCGKCCANPQVMASPLEFLPLAFELHAKGSLEDLLNHLLGSDGAGNCTLYRPTSEDGSMGSCGNHPSRGLICRLFASSARKNKYGKKELIICKVLKENKPDAFEQASEAIQGDLPIALAATYYSKLGEIDRNLTDHFPINQAIRLALEMVLRFVYYQEMDSEEGH